jgi:sec-independent protein translocase protein TatA
MGIATSADYSAIGGLVKGRKDMLGDLFDSPWKILIVAVVLIVLFGSAKLPVAARSLGKSMRILKSEIKDLHGGDNGPEVVPPVAEVQSAPHHTQQPG